MSELNIQQEKRILLRNWYNFKASNQKDLRKAYFAGAKFVLQTIFSIAKNGKADAFQIAYNDMLKDVRTENDQIK